MPIDKDHMKEINVGGMNWSVTAADKWQSAKIFYPEIDPEKLSDLRRALSRLCLF